MNLITIMNYDFADVRRLVMCRSWMDSVQRCDPGAAITVLVTRPLPPALQSHFDHYGNVQVVVGEYDPSVRIPHGPFAIHNVFFKLYQLSRLREPFLFLDADIVVLDSLVPLWECRREKPWIGVDHQLNIPGHTGRERFLNSGVQLVGDPDFYDYGRILDCAREHNFRFLVPGTDQACLWTYFRSIGYDYTHPSVGSEWNACAGYVALSRDAGGRWKGYVRELQPVHGVRVNHYWGPFKPWKIGCPIHDEACA